MQLSSPFMRLAERLTFLFFALGASDVCLVCENPTCSSVPALWGCEGLWSYDCAAMHDNEYSPPSPSVSLSPRESSGKDVDITFSPSLPGPIPSERPDPTKPNPRLGVGHIMSWSSDGRYLATRNDNMPSALWVWDAEDLGLCSLVVQVGWLPGGLARCFGDRMVGPGVELSLVVPVGWFIY